MCPVHQPGKTNRRSSERLRLSTFRLKVYVWDEKFGGDPLQGFCFASDLSANGAGAYVAEKIAPGNSVRICLEIPTGNSYRGNVVWSSRFSLSQGFLGHDSFKYRMGIRLRFGSEAERQRYLSYLEELKERVMRIKPGMSF